MRAYFHVLIFETFDQPESINTSILGWRYARPLGGHDDGFGGGRIPTPTREGPGQLGKFGLHRREAVRLPGNYKHEIDASHSDIPYSQARPKSSTDLAFFLTDGKIIDLSHSQRHVISYTV